MKGSLRNRKADPHESVGKDLNFDEERRVEVYVYHIILIHLHVRTGCFFSFVLGGGEYFFLEKKVIYISVKMRQFW